VIVPDGVLFGSSTAHRKSAACWSRTIVRCYRQAAVRRIPAYAGVSTAIVLLTKTNSGGRIRSGSTIVSGRFSLDDKRTVLLSAINRRGQSSVSEHSKNNLPDITAAGRSAMVPSANARAPRRVFAYPRRRSRRPATTLDQSLQGSGARGHRA